MKSFPLQYVALALIVTVAAAWVLPVPHAVLSTYAAAFALLVGVLLVAAVTWRNALPTDTIGQLLHRTEDEAAAPTRSRKSGR